MTRDTLSYEDSGLDVQTNSAWVRHIGRIMRRSHGPSVLSDPGAFAGAFRIGRGRKGLVLAASADGVGTKVLLGIKADRLYGLGIDLVAMNVNDLVTCGAKPLFFLDYLAVKKLESDRLLPIVKGISAGCRLAGCAFLGGETAQMGKMYAPGQFDLVGFVVGVVEGGKLIGGQHVAPGDALIGLPSNGLHANGYTLVRKWISRKKLQLHRSYVKLGETLADALLRPTKIYTEDVLSVLDAYRPRRVVTGMAHITGGGLQENVARLLGKGCDAVIQMDSWEAPAIFPFMQDRGMRWTEMVRIFNMGIGFVLSVRRRYVKGVFAKLKNRGASPIEIGSVQPGKGKVILR